MGNTQRVILTVVISVGILVAWQAYFAPPPPAPPPGQQAADATEKTDQGPTGTGVAPNAAPGKADGGSAPASAAPSEAPGPVTRSPVGTITTLTVKHAVAEFTDRGAALRSWKLRNDRYVEDRGGKLLPVDLVNVEPGTSPWPLLTHFPGSDFTVPQNAKFKRVSATADQVHYRWSSDKVTLDKIYKLDPRRPVVRMTVKLRNTSEQKLRERLEVALFHRQDPNLAKPSFTNPYPRIPMVQCYVNGEIERRSVSSIRGEDTGCSAAGCGMGEGPLARPGEVTWIGSGDRYFLTAVVPEAGQVQRRCELKVRNETENVIEAAMLHPEHTLAPGEEKSWDFTVFAGAKTLSELDAVKGPETVDPRLHEAIEFGWFEVLCRPMLWLMQQFHAIFGNWGVAIILLTLVVKLLTLYWTHKSMMSMRQMSKLKPDMDRLREKYGEDKQRLNQEMMALYKRHKVNPLGGCLPMVIQMPIWFALYRTLGNSVELYRSGFVGWITDLTAPDPYYVLPIAMGISMYAQQAITPQPMDNTQAKMMKYFMPGMFTVMMLALPSGLTLYIFVNTLLTMLHQVYMNKKDPLPQPALAGDAKAAGGSAGPRTRARQETGDEETGGPGRPTGPRKAKAKRRKRKNR